MSFKIATIAAAFALTAAPAVLAQAPTTNLQACVPAGQYNVAYDYFPQKISIADSTSNIEVEYKNNYKIVKNKKSGASYVLYQCGTPAPTVAGTNATFAVPVANVAMLDTTAVTYLELLGVREHIKVSTSPDLITSACLQKMGADKLTTALNDANPAATTTTLNTVDMTISYGDEKIKNATKTYVEFPATSDAGVLHRSQYLQFLAPFFNKEEVANTLTKSISDNYVCLKDAAGKAANVNGKPTVAFMYQYNGNYTCLQVWQCLRRQQA
ncbi:hypothetical protein DFS34DRAFT_231800 [Phlyctochytrium arcticum]|nr:hypothetical protein DFS34DRAFT_231800 [Phlyctochytrium arcticum]